MTEIAKKINEAIQMITQLDNAKKYYAVLTANLGQMQAELNEKTIHLNKEQDDIESLEKLSVNAVFHKLLGNKDAMLEKERQEYLSLALKIKELKKSIELTTFEANVVQQKALAADQWQAKLNALKVERENEILHSGESVRSALKSIIQEIDHAQRLKAEFIEAAQAGSHAATYVHQTLSHLEAAMKYGEWDMYGADQMQYAKHGSLDNAAQSAYHAQRSLQIYNRELLDVGISDELLQVNVGHFSGFTDIFFDNLITDWIIQKKIKNSAQQVKSILEKINLIQLTIDEKVAKIEDSISELIVQKDQILLQSNGL